MAGWTDDLRFYVLFNSISVMSGQWAGDNEKQCAMEKIKSSFKSRNYIQNGKDWETRLRLKCCSPQAGLEPGTARSAGDLTLA